MGQHALCCRGAATFLLKRIGAGGVTAPAESFCRAEGEAMLVVCAEGAEAGDVHFLRLVGGGLYGSEHSLHCGGGCAAGSTRTHVALNAGDELFLVHRKLGGGGESAN